MISPYRGRFAPSPTGPLHFGSLVAAAASYIDARAAGGEWLVRMEDIDTDRTQRGAAERILEDLEHFGLEWDGPVLRQSERRQVYEVAFEGLRKAGLVYPCSCSRKQAADQAANAGGPVRRYRGACAAGLPSGRTVRSWRVRVGAEPVCFEDRLQGLYCQALAAEAGDFVLLRADGPFAYQLAVVVDDAAQGITDVVRGADLLENTPRQIYLQRQLRLPVPRYLHIPVATGRSGLKLSKQTKAPPVRRERAGSQLWAALAFLNQDPPAGLEREHPGTVLRWAIQSWRLDRLPAAQTLPQPACVEA
jgi:glutamyl-Q tRNA(Asp) synthetase